MNVASDDLATASKPLSKARRRLLRLLPKAATGAEIGVWLGDYSRHLVRVAAPSKLYLIDAWASIDDPKYSRAIVGRNSQERMDAAHAHVMKEMADEITAGQVQILRGRSAEMVARIPDASLDFAYVDADHSYEGVSADIAALWPKLKAEAWLGFDDYVVGGWWQDGVVRAVNELIGRYPADLQVHFKFGSQLLLRRGPLTGRDAGAGETAASGSADRGARRRLQD